MSINRRLEGKGLFLLGTGVMQVPAILEAKKLGAIVYGADGSAKSAGMKLCDTFLPVDLKDTGRLIEKARALYRDGKIHGVFTAGTDFSQAVAAIAGELGLSSHSTAAAQKASDKALMRAAFSLAQVPTVAYKVYGLDDRPVPPDFDPPYVIKPSDNMGARGVKKIDKNDDFVAALVDALSYSRSGRAIVEEYIEGPEFSIDALVYRNKFIVCGLADRHIRYEPHFIEIGHTMPGLLAASYKKEIVETFYAGIQALGLTWGAAKGDIKLTREGVKIGEIAARLSGGYMSGWTYPYSSGVNVTRAAIELAFGLEPEFPPGTQKEMFCCERALISVPGKVIGINGMEKAAKMHNIKNLFMRAEYGQVMEFPKNNVQKAGNVISTAKDFKTAEKSALDVVTSIDIILEPGNVQTEEFLFRKDIWPPAAYSGADPDLLFRMRYYPIENPELPMEIPLIEGLLEETALDYNNIPLGKAIQEISEWEKIPFAKVPGVYGCLGKCFFEALVAGGRQGGLWFIRTLKKADNKRVYINRIKDRYRL